MLTGLEAKRIIRAMDVPMQDVAECLQMSKQNLSNHLRKDFISNGFYRLLKEKFPLQFTNNKEPNQPNIQSQKTNIMKDQNYQIILSALTDKIQKLEEKLNHYEAVKPNSREVG